MDIWIDLESGTWGSADQIVLVTLSDSEDSLNELAELSDGQRIEWAKQWGHSVVAAS